MKKTLLSAAAFAVAGVSAVAIMPTTSEAIPAFARQTGAACLSCHFQTFPALNSFGRSFKINAFTDVGEQAMIEDEGLSLPSVMNASFVVRAKYILSKVTTAGATAGAAASAAAGANAAARAGAFAGGSSLAAANAAGAAAGAAANAAALAGGTVSNRSWAIPTDANLLLAGRIGANTGAFIEFNAGAGNWQLMNSFDMDGLRIGLNIANTGFGPTAALETTSVYGQHSGKLNGTNLSAVQAIIIGNGTLTGTAGVGNPNTTSVALWAGNESFTVQGAMIAYADGNAAAGLSPNLVPLVRGTYVADLGDAELLIGATITSGTQSVNTAGAAALGLATGGVGVDAKWIDFQVQGEMGDASYGIYGDFVTTKSKAAGGLNSNIFAANVDAKHDGFGIRAEIKPLHNILFGAGFMTDKVTAAVAGVNNITKFTTSQISGTYEIYQNMELNVSYTSQKSTDTAQGSATTKTYLIDLEALM